MSKSLKASAPFCAALWIMWQGHPTKYTEGFNALTLEFLAPILVLVLSTPKAVQWSHGISFFSTTQFLASKISLALEAFAPVVRQRSRNFCKTTFFIHIVNSYSQRIHLTKPCIIRSINTEGVWHLLHR